MNRLPLPCWLLLTLLQFTSCVATTRAPPSTISPRCTKPTAIDIVHHDIDLSLTLTPPSLSGRGALRLKTRELTRHIVLDADLEVTEVATAEGQLRFTRDGSQLCVELPRMLPAASELGLRIDFRVPAARKMPSFTRQDVWAGYHTSSWMPTLQDPAQRATLALRITAPSNLTVTASGSEQPAIAANDDRVVHSFVIDRPTPPFLYAFAAGQFDAASRDVEGLELRAIGPVGADLKGALLATEYAYRFLIAKLALRLPVRRYTQVFLQGSAAQEAAGLALLSAKFLEELQHDEKEDWAFTHELAHQWFGWLLPCVDFADFWLNEGFATFVVAAVKEARWGRPAYDREVQLWRARSAKVHEQGRDMPVALSTPDGPQKPPPTDAQLPPRGVTYARGALVLHRLRDELGDTCFWTGIRSYVNKYAGKGARTEDLRKALESACNHELRAFFARWVYAAAPEL